MSLFIDTPPLQPIGYPSTAEQTCQKTDTRRTILRRVCFIGLGVLILSAGLLIFSILQITTPSAPVNQVSGEATLLPLDITESDLELNDFTTFDLASDTNSYIFDAEVSTTMPYYNSYASLAQKSYNYANDSEQTKLASFDIGADLFHLSDGRIAFNTSNGNISIERLSIAEPQRLVTLMPNIKMSPQIKLCSAAPLPYSNGIQAMLREVGLKAPLHKSGYSEKYRILADTYAKKYTLPLSLILAIIHTESNFNPQAVSASNALGLMQIVQSTAGNEVYKYLKGDEGTPSTEILLAPEHNIQYGATYLHLLNKRYFQDVADTESRIMCVIAAYNGGPGAVLRSFDMDKDMAITKINEMTPEDVYDHLVSSLPSAETRRYVTLVLNNQRNYIQ